MMRFRPIGFVVFSLLLVTLACNAPFGIGGSSQNESPSEGNTEPSGRTVISEDLDPGSLFILVVDPDGDPIYDAQIGDSRLFTNRNGVAVGQVSTTPGGWFPIHAPGFATTYTRAITKWNGYPIALSILTPLGPAALIEVGSTTTFTVENSRREQAQVSIVSGSFAEPQVLLSWSDIPLTQLDSRFGNAPEMEHLLLQGAFALEATSLDGEALVLKSKGGVTLYISWDLERDEIPVLGSFNPVSGTWELLSEDCQLDNEGLMACTLPHLSELGFFGYSPDGGGWDEDDDKEGDDFSSSFGSSLDDAMGGGAGGAATAGGGAAGGGAAGGGDDNGGTNGGLAGGLDGMRGSGEGLGTEVDKMTALIAAGMAMENGLDGLADQYLDQARKAIKDIAKDLLEDPSCGTVYELFTAASQAWLVGDLDDLGDQLSNKAQEIYKRCGIWKGTVTYTYKLQDTWPHAEKWKYESGARTWIEVHKITINVDPKTGAIDGESHVHLAFSTSTYRQERNTPCGPVHNDHEAETDPTDGEAILLFDGNFDGENFSIGELKVAQSNPVTLQHHAWLSKTFAEPVAPPPSCPPVTTEEISRQTIADYTSQLLHGFFGQPEPPNLEEMLNTGTRRMQEDRVFGITGMKELTYAVGSNLSPLLPIESGEVHWNFTRVAEGSE